MLPPDRKGLQLPHGSLVRRTGENQPPFAGPTPAVGTTPASPGDITVALVVDRKPTVTFKVVPGAPSTTATNPPEVQVADPVLGQLRFGVGLPAAGRIDASYFIGSWDVRSERFAGDLRVDAFARDVATVDGLSRRLEASLSPDRVRQIAGLNKLTATSWGPLVKGQLGAGRLLGPDTRRRSLTYHFDYEREEPVVVSAGGPIQRVRVQSTLSVGPQGATNQFDVITREGSR